MVDYDGDEFENEILCSPWIVDIMVNSGLWG
jgi:hypothetical protein